MNFDDYFILRINIFQKLKKFKIVFFFHSTINNQIGLKIADIDNIGINKL